MRLGACLCFLAWYLNHPLILVLANNEKTVFLAPAVLENLNQQPGLHQLNLPVLTPSDWSLRTHLPAAFPDPDHPWGTQSWFLLDRLTQYHRYEVRVCWSANVFSPPVFFQHHWYHHTYF